MGLCKDRHIQKQSIKMIFLRNTCEGACVLPKIIRFIHEEAELSGGTHNTEVLYLSNTEVLVFYLSIGILCYFVLLLHNNSEANIVLFAPPYVYLITLVAF